MKNFLNHCVQRNTFLRNASGFWISVFFYILRAGKSRYMEKKAKGTENSPKTGGLLKPSFFGTFFMFFYFSLSSKNACGKNTIFWKKVKKKLGFSQIIEVEPNRKKNKKNVKNSEFWASRWDCHLVIRL